VTVDIFLLNEDGNLMDACFLSTVLALMNTRLPEVTLSKDKIKVNEEKFKNLNVHHIPVCTSFYLIEGL
jgi:exosome complex RNA-binding protein Rrp42 (RNase PH superfamily)